MKILHRFRIGLFLFLIPIGIFAESYSENLKSKIDSGAVPSFSEVKAEYRPSEAVLLDRNGQSLQTLRLNPKFRRLAWTQENEIPETFVLAMLAQEDKRFAFHNGLDYWAVFGSLKDRILSNGRRGASTISMQVAGFLLGSKPGERTILDKFAQISLATRLEESWTKSEIAEAYWNLVPFKGELLGIRAGARGVFGVEPSSLAPEESLLLVSLLPSPNIGSRRWENRACQLAKKIGREDLCPAIGEAIANYKKPRNIWNTETRSAYHAAHRLFRRGEAAMDSQATGSLRSTIDFFSQQKAEAALERVLSSVKDKNVREAGILAIENKSGAVLIYVGNSKLYSENYFVDAIQARRQAGSTLKPFLYSIAFESKLLEPESILFDRPKEWELVGGAYRPSNYEDRYWGEVSAKTALASSLNIPAVQVLEWVGVPRFVAGLQEFGFGKLERPDFYGLSLALGTADISLWELTNAYRTIANDGFFGELTFYPEEGEANRLHWNSSREASFRKIIDSDSVSKVRSILSSRENRALGFGWESNLSTKFSSFAKTGTSQDMRDNWCVGSSENFTVGVWVGNMSGEPMHDVSGITGAAPLWKEVLTILEDLRPSRNVIAQNEIESKKELTVTKAAGKTRILYPENGNVFALDPEIPKENEIIRFKVRSNAKTKTLEWILNGKRVAKTEKDTLDWKPTRGNYFLSVRDESGVLSETVVFQVR